MKKNLLSVFFLFLFVQLNAAQVKETEKNFFVSFS